MRYSGADFFGRIAMSLASWFAPPYKARCYLAQYSEKGYIDPGAVINHSCLKIGKNVFIGNRVIIYQVGNGKVELGRDVQLYGDIIIETGNGGSLVIESETHVQPKCQFSAYLGSIRIGRRVEIAPYCCFYPYDHGVRKGIPVREQPLRTKSGIIVGDDAWIGVGVVVLDGVRIGNGAIIGAGSIVTNDIPDNAIAFGVPAIVNKMRND